MLRLLCSFLLFILVAAQQDPLGPTAPNAGDLVGTWSSGTGAVQTGPNFANPTNFSFNYPSTTGVSYSFSQDGHFEEAWYFFNSNGSNPNCIQGVIQWQHGSYQALANGSIFMFPIASDGRQQVQDTCAAVSNVIQQFNTTIFMSTWEIRQDPQWGTQLWLYQFDGRPLSPMYQVANPPIMLPTETLTVNVTVGQQLNSGALPIPRAVWFAMVVSILGGWIGIALVFRL